MKRRILIVDLDCPFGINHFDLMLCDECVNGEMMAEKLQKMTGISPPPPFTPMPSTGTLQWTQTITGAGSTTTDLTGNFTDIQWSNVGGGSSTHTLHLTLDNNAADTTSAFKLVSNVS